MYYIQRKGQGYLETVDEADNRNDAKFLLGEYRISDPGAEYYISSRPCNDWRDR